MCETGRRNSTAQYSKISRVPNIRKSAPCFPYVKCSVLVRLIHFGGFGAGCNNCLEQIGTEILSTPKEGKPEDAEAIGLDTGAELRSQMTEGFFDTEGQETL